MARSDVVLTAITASPNPFTGQMNSRPVQVASGTIYYFFVDGGANLHYVKSTDGLSWGDPVVFQTGAATFSNAIWYDRWTPGNTGNLIHVAMMDATNDNVTYRNIDVSSDTLSTQTTVFDGASLATSASTCVSICRTRGGNLMVGYNGDGGAEEGFATSVDIGANWVAKTNFNEGVDDYFILMPGVSAADTQDGMAIYWDRSADEISRKNWDDSGNSWSTDAEASIATSMTDIASTTCAPQFAATVDAANSKILLAAWSNRDLANADLRYFTINDSSITENTNVVLNSTDDQQMCGLTLIGTTVYAYYGGKSDGSENAGTSITINYKTSTDAGSTWGSETALSNSARNFKGLNVCLTATDHCVAMIADELTQTEIVFYSALLPSSGGTTTSWW